MQLRYFLLFFISLSVIACDHNHHAPKVKDEVSVNNAWVRTTPPGVNTSALYLSIDNLTTEDILLVAIQSPLTERIEIHHSKNEDGMMKMSAIDNIAVTSGATVLLEPNGMHGMLFNLAEALREGETQEFELVFESHPKIKVTASVQDGPPSAHNH